MALDVQPILEAAASYASTLGVFDRVMGHEPQNPPGSGLTMAIWVEHLRPNPKRSGLAVTSVVLDLMQRVYKTAAAEPADGIDPAMTGAVQAIFNKYSTGFTLGGLVTAVDLLGEGGALMDAKAGYLQTDEGATYRVYDIFVPLLIDDVWVQSA